MKRVNFYIVVTMLVIIEIISIFLMCKTLTAKPTLDDVRLKEEENKETFAIMLGDKNGVYTESDSNSWPSSKSYTYNSERSGCIDNNGNKIENSLTFDSTANVATVNVSETAYCYLYFDIKLALSDLCSSGDNLGSCLTDNNSEIDSLGDTSYSGMYRYTGTDEDVDDNYICFGTADKNECINNTDKYLYRMIGITSEANTTLGLDTNQVKVIKDESVGTYNWHTSYSSDIKWESSAIYTYLNNDILSNTTYIPSGWSSKIDSVKWNVGDVQPYTNALTIVELEDDIVTSSTSKIGLMYLSDYFYTYNVGGTQNCYSSACSSWMTDSSAAQWTMTRYGFLDGYYSAWSVTTDGYVVNYHLANTFAVRPTFYLEKDETYISGSGTIDDPIIIGEPISAGEEIIANKPPGLDTTTSYSGLYRYVGNDVNNYVDIGGVSYRIIGITSEANTTLGLEANQLKVIKTDSIGTYNWHSSNTSDIKWEASDMYAYLQGSNVLSNTSVMPSGWSSKIDSVKWYIGDVNTTNSTNASTVYDYENNTTTSGTSKIGLIYLSDYFYSAEAGGTTNCNSTTCTSSWIYNSSLNQWTMTRFGYFSTNNTYYAWRASADSYVRGNFITNTYEVRPVFYLLPSVAVKSGTGTGTSSDPFVLQ